MCTGSAIDQDHRQVMILELESLASSTVVATPRTRSTQRQNLDDRDHSGRLHDDGLDRPDDLDHRHDRDIDQPASVIAWTRVGLRAGYEITMLASGEAMEPACLTGRLRPQSSPHTVTLRRRNLRPELPLQYCWASPPPVILNVPENETPVGLLLGLDS
jgi:hypothetical protein